MATAKYQCRNVLPVSRTTGTLSRHDLLQWINSLLGLNLKKVESLCSGTAYCRLMDIIFPGCLSLKRIKFEANQEHEYILNLKILQLSFHTVGCTKDVPINGLIKGRFQENFEFLQWFERFFNANYCGQSGSLSSPIPTIPTKSTPSATSKVIPLKKDNPHSVPRISPASSAYQTQDDLKTQVHQMGCHTDSITKERDFYFDKLRRIEILCTEATEEDTASGEEIQERKEFVSKILEKLYETEEGFSVPDEESY